VHLEKLAGQFLCGQFASFGCEAGLLGFGGTLLLPWLKVAGLIHILWILDPLNDLGHGNEINIVVVFNDFINPVQECIKELRVVFQPGSMEKQSKWGTILVVMSVKVVGEEVVELVSTEDVGTGVNHGTAREIFVHSRILPSVKFIHDHFPNGMRPGGALLEVTMAPVRHSEVHGVWPSGGF